MPVGSRVVACQFYVQKGLQDTVQWFYSEVQLPQSNQLYSNTPSIEDQINTINNNEVKRSSPAINTEKIIILRVTFKQLYTNKVGG